MCPTDSFRPLWGSCLSQCNDLRLDKVGDNVSVPYGDHVCLNWRHWLVLQLWRLVSVPYGDHVCLNTVSGNALFWLAREAICGANAASPPAAHFFTLKCPEKPIKSGCGAKITFLTSQQAPACPFPYHTAFPGILYTCTHAEQSQGSSLFGAYAGHIFYQKVSCEIHHL